MHYCYWHVFVPFLYFIIVAFRAVLKYRVLHYLSFILSAYFTLSLFSSIYTKIKWYEFAFSYQSSALTHFVLRDAHMLY
jgi:hypothetical protein